jgi:hypothetical protein
MLSDESGEARKAYSVGRGLMGLSEGRVTFFIDSEGVVRYVLCFESLLFSKILTLVVQRCVRFGYQLQWTSQSRVASARRVQKCW